METGFRPPVAASSSLRATLHSHAVRATTAATIAEAFRITAEDHADRVAVRTKDDEVSLTWGELRDRVDALAGGLARLGVRRGQQGAAFPLNRGRCLLPRL